MPGTRPLPPDYDTTRRELQRVATHVLARARAAHGDRFGLRATASGIATPMFGPGGTVVRLAGATLIVEDADATRTLALTGCPLAEAAAFAGVDLGAAFRPGADAPPVGDVTAPLRIGAEAASTVLASFALGARVLDAVLPHLEAPTTAQVWPEHFDLGLGAATASGGVTLGASPGDDLVGEPYLYVSPWTAARPGDPTYWNAPFGATTTAPDEAAGRAFLLRGLGLLSDATTDVH